MNKNIISYIAIVSLAVIPSAVFGQTATPSPVGATASSAISTSGATASSGLTVSGATASSANSTSGATASSGQSTSGATSGAGLSVSNGTASATPAPVPPVNNGGGSTSSGNGSSVSSTETSSGSSNMSGRRRSSSGSSGSSCALINTYMRSGAANDSAEVTKLQSFFKNTLGYDVDVNGIFDQKTVTAVKAFQNKYAETIMAPWGITEATGNVYITTLKQINKLACSQPLTLDSSELAIINSYRNGNKSVSGVNQVGNEVPVKVVIDSDANTSTSSSEDNSGNNLEDQSENVATVAKASILGRFWNFVVSLFK